jgi:F-type H+-transporting ATPase subunit epsilon
VSILAEVVELADEIDTARARQALDGATGDDDESKAAARRATARLRAVGETV